MIRPDERTRWQADDYLLEEEFSDECTQLRQVVRDTPPVPPEVNGRIRILAARREITEPVEKNAVFSKELLLALAVLLLFAVALLFALLVDPLPGVSQRTGDPAKRGLTPLKTIDYPQRTAPQSPDHGEPDEHFP